MQTTVDESAPRGKVSVATKNYLPGELILEEEPILMVTKESMESLASTKKWTWPDALVSVAYCMLQSLSTEAKAQVLSMFGPADDAMYAEMRRAIASCSCLGLTPAEIGVFVRLTSIMKRNKFCLSEDIVLLLPQMSSFAHSCDGNCHWRMHHPMVVQVRAVRHIQAGEELKFAYSPKESRKYTHERRQFYLEEFGFTCHCPRCDAPGDDTRQFDCFDPACRGVMMVCQPINKNKAYTGVEYVEPHLLPCTVCHRPAPATYQSKMLALEARLWDLLGQFTRQENELKHTLARSLDLAAPLRFRQEIERHHLPMRHSLCVFVHRLLLRTAPPLHLTLKLSGEDWQAECRRRVLCAAKDYIAAQERDSHGANMMLLEIMQEACHESIVLGAEMPPGVGVSILPADAKVLLQQTLRVMLVLQGREVCPQGCTCRVELDTYLCKTLQQLPVPVEVCDMQVCAFCEESPLRAAMVLGRCGKCKNVAYCGSGCQKAHWKLHKKSCVVK